MKKTIQQFIKFGIVGSINTFSSWIFYYSLLFLNINYLISTTIAYILSSIIGYFLNNSWVFKNKIYDQKGILKYYIVYGSSYLINICSMYIFVDILSISEIISPILVLFITVPYNFIFNKIWVFTTKENKYLHKPQKYHTFVICAYKESPYLEDAIKSIKNQTLKSNIIMTSSTKNKHIDDLSKKYKIKTYYRNGKSDIQDDWNFAVSNTNTELVTIVHQDDIYNQYYLENILNNYTGKELMLFTENNILKNDIEISNKNLIIKRIIKFPLRIPVFSNIKFIRKLTLSFGNTVNCPAVTYNKSKLNLPIFTSDLKFGLDWDTYLKIYSMKGKLKYIPHKLVSYRVHEEATTTSFIKNNKRYEEDVIMFSKIWPKFIVKIIMKFYIKAYDVYEK